MSDFVKGDEIAKIAGCTPQNVSMHIKNLRWEGFDIEVSHRGYKYDREPENRLVLLKEKYQEKNIRFDYLRSCINLLNIIKKEKSGKNILCYTFDEMDVPIKSHIRGLSFAINYSNIQNFQNALTDFLMTYLGDEILISEVSGEQNILCQRYVIGRYSSSDNIEYFHLYINNKKPLLSGKKSVMSFSDILGDYIGIRGISVLIFEHLYATLIT